MNSLARVIIGISFLFLSAVAVNLRPISRVPESKMFVVEEGEGFRAIIDRLAEEGIIRSATTSKLYGLFSGSAHQIKPGAYNLNVASNTSRIIQELITGPRDVILTVTEGETVIDIARKLETAGIVPASDFLRVAERLEGYLFPDTYRFAPQSSPEAIVLKFTSNFEEKVEALLSGTAYDGLEIKSADLYEKLTIASLIEKEIPHEADRPIVSGIIDRRLSIGMPLQVDATIIYGTCGKTFYGCPPLTKSDFISDSPFNTYTRQGLPPSPIGNPGIQAVRAALWPQHSSYLYYLTDPKTNQTILSATLDEHNENRARYLGL